MIFPRISTTDEILNNKQRKKVNQKERKKGKEREMDEMKGEGNECPGGPTCM